jgi:hypothetical protein
MPVELAELLGGVGIFEALQDAEAGRADEFAQMRGPTQIGRARVQDSSATSWIREERSPGSFGGEEDWSWEGGAGCEKQSIIGPIHDHLKGSGQREFVSAPGEVRSEAFEHGGETAFRYDLGSMSDVRVEYACHPWPVFGDGDVEKPAEGTSRFPRQNNLACLEQIHEDRRYRPPPSLVGLYIAKRHRKILVNRPTGETEIQVARHFLGWCGGDRLDHPAWRLSRLLGMGGEEVRYVRMVGGYQGVQQTDCPGIQSRHRSGVPAACMQRKR